MGWRAAHAERTPVPPCRTLPCRCAHALLLVIGLGLVEVVWQAVALFQVRRDVGQAVAVPVAVRELGRVAQVRVRHGSMGGCSQVGWVAGHGFTAACCLTMPLSFVIRSGRSYTQARGVRAVNVSCLSTNALDPRVLPLDSVRLRLQG